ncbi:MAG: biotin synthase BioB [Desulfotomaculaceae bacterium]|nr:biotin synthase BioB [Desulfotomaculaceae bacterium]
MHVRGGILVFSCLLNQILSGDDITFDQALTLGKLDDNQLNELFLAALRVTRHFYGNRVDLCSIINAKSGRCSENCAFCAQSVHYQTNIPAYPILSKEIVLENAYEMESKGTRCFSLVTSGKGIQGDDFEKVIDIYKTLREKTQLSLCASLGIIDYTKALRLKEVGVTMYHHNIETSRSFFPEICTTHSFEDRLETIRSASKAGLDICSGGIVGLGETWEHRVEMAFQLKELGVVSLPLNTIDPIPGTPLWKKPVPEPTEILKTAAMFRMVLPGAIIRLCGGRESALRSLQPFAFTAGINGMLIGNYLTTTGREVEDDMQMLKDLKLEVMRPC